MAEAVAVPVTVKTRIGVDDHDSYEFLAAFVDRVGELAARYPDAASYSGEAIL